MSDLSPRRTTSPAGGPLTRRQKAAVVIHLLVSGGADPGLRDLPPEQQRQIVRETARLRFVDRATLAAVVSEFASELDSIGLHFPRDPTKIVAALQNQLSLDVIEGLAAEMGGTGMGDGAWTMLANLDADALSELTEGETDEVCAILLSKLPGARAAEVMDKLPPDRALSIAAAFARTDSVAPEAVSRIGMALTRQTGARADAAFESDSVLRVAGILNGTSSGTRRGILERLDGTDAGFAGRVRRAVFSYENIPDRIDPRDVPKILRAVDSRQLVVALAGTPPEMSGIKDFLLGSISGRLADQIRGEIEEMGAAPPPEDAEAAMSEIVTAIREMEEAGELKMLTPEE